MIFTKKQLLINVIQVAIAVKTTLQLGHELKKICEVEHCSFTF